MIAGPRRYRNSLALLTLWLLAGCTATVTPTAPSAGLVADYRHWMVGLTEPAMEGRGLGTEGLDRARDALVDHLRGAGLEPGFGSSYTQPVDVTLDPVIERATLNLGGRPVAESKLSVMGMSGSGTVESEAVFVGYGIDAEGKDHHSYGGGVDVKGRVVVAFRYEP
ncbi:MAG: hypothetical protein R3336_06450, partial [Phycisphaeraceae bacterium]|nr:hypothetical protein [Phycisphaeraceae bacterium]